MDLLFSRPQSAESQQSPSSPPRPIFKLPPKFRLVRGCLGTARQSFSVRRMALTRFAQRPGRRGGPPRRPLSSFVQPSRPRPKVCGFRKRANSLLWRAAEGLEQAPDALHADPANPALKERVLETSPKPENMAPLCLAMKQHGKQKLQISSCVTADYVSAKKPSSRNPKQNVRHRRLCEDFSIR